MKIDCSNLVSEMAKKEVSIHEIAFLLGEEDEAVMSKMRGTPEGSYKEVTTTRGAMSPKYDLGYLFKEKKRQDA